MDARTTRRHFLYGGALAGAFPDGVTYADTRTHGCAFVEFGPDEVRARYLGSRDVTTVDGSLDVRRIADLRVPRATPEVQVASRA